MFKLPQNFESALKSYLKKTFYPGTRKEDFSVRDFTEGDYRFFAKGVGRLTEYFTSDRGSLPRNYFNQKDLRSGYLFYFLPVNALKVAGLLNYIPDPFFQRPLKVLDLGSGPGTGMVGVDLRSGRGATNHYSLADQNRDVLQDALGLKAALGIPGEIRTRVGDLLNNPLAKVVPPEPYDLILLVNFLNEFSSERRASLLDILLRRYLAPGGRILIAEPALQRITRELMELRDELLQTERGHVYAPCLHQEACPMLAHNQRDWCHIYLDWERPRWIEKLDRMLHLRKEYLKSSFLILGNEPAPTYPAETWRVVSGHINSKGKSEMLLCGPGGLPQLKRVTRLDRDQSPANQDFDRAQRGDLVETVVGDRLTKEKKFWVR